MTSSRVSLGLCVIGYVLHYYLVDRPLGLQPAFLWRDYRFGLAGVAALGFLATFSPAVVEGPWYRLPLGTCGVAFGYFQAESMTWYAAVPYFYAFLIPGVIASLLQTTPLKSVAYLAVVHALQLRAFLASTASAQHLVSAAVVEVAIVVLFRVRADLAVAQFMAAHEDRALRTPREAETTTGDTRSRTDEDAGQEPSSKSEHCVWRREGEYCTLTFDGVTIRLRCTAGLVYLGMLLDAPNQGIPALWLAQVDGVPRWIGSALPVIDEQAQAAYRARLKELATADPDGARGKGDPAEMLRRREEMEFLTAELTRAVGLGHRQRYVDSAGERARVNVTKALRAALRRIAAVHPGLGEHLARTVRTGIVCIYDPDPRSGVTWQVSR